MVRARLGSFKRKSVGVPFTKNRNDAVLENSEEENGGAFRFHHRLEVISYQNG